MMSFYDRKGPESWSQGIVPHFITSNSFIGRAYAKVLHGFLQDALLPTSPMKIDVTQPLYIIELGVGSGKFSYYMLKALEEMQETCAFPFSKIIFVMTDFTENNFNFWADHPQLKKYFESGNLDAGIFDAVSDTEIRLRSGAVLKPQSLVNPLCIVANYLFDTLYHDIFQVDGGVLKEGLVSVGSKQKEDDPLNPEIIKRLKNVYRYDPITPNYYTSENGDEVHLERILQWYVDYFKQSPASILIPIGALRALRRLVTFASHRCIVISGDKGNNNPDQFSGLMDPHIAVHGSFSLMVNYHAIGLWFVSKGGFVLHNPQEEASLKVSAFVMNGLCNNDAEWETYRATSTQSRIASAESNSYMELMTPLEKERSRPFAHLRNAFADTIDIFGPNDFFVLQKSIKEDMVNPPLRTIVSLLKLGDWDPDVFFKFRDAILTQAPNCGGKLRNDLCRGIPRVWKNYYFLDTDKDIAFEIGRFYYGIKDYAKALYFYEDSTKHIGEHHVTYHNQGLCYYSLSKYEKAMEFFEKAMSMNADYDKARTWYERVKKEIQDKAAASNGHVEKTSEEMAKLVIDKAVDEGIENVRV